MKRISTALAAGVASAVLAAGTMPALAGGPVVAPPAPAPMAPAPMAPVGTDWTGLSAGLTLGYGNASFGGSSGSGVLYGLQGAYDYDMGNWVVGATASYNFSDIGIGADKMTRLGRLGLRGGLDLGTTYVYATGGLAYAALDTPGPTVTDTGWFAGVGAQYKMRGNWLLGGELLTNQFSNFNSSGSDLRATTFGLNASLKF